MIDNQPQQPVQQPKKTNWTFWIFFVIGLIIGLIWLLVFTKLGLFLNLTNDLNLTEFQKSLFNLALLLTIFYFLAIVGVFYFNSKKKEIEKKSKSPIIIYESDSQFDKIREKARYSYGLTLGNCVRNKPLAPHTEAGSASPTRSLLFENIENGFVSGYSRWVIHSFDWINIHLAERNYIGRNSDYRYWDGEFRQQQHKGIADTSAGKKAKDITFIKSVDNEGSMTEDE